MRNAAPVVACPCHHTFWGIEYFVIRLLSSNYETQLNVCFHPIDKAMSVVYALLNREFNELIKPNHGVLGFSPILSSHESRIERFFVFNLLESCIKLAVLDRGLWLIRY